MATFLLEIRAEEIPANALSGARRQLKELFTKHLFEAGFKELDIDSMSTSRRLVVSISNLPLRQADRSEELSGPPSRIAFDDEGNPSKAALGFAKKVGLPFDQIGRIETPKGEYLAATVVHPGSATIDILSAMAPKVIKALRFPKMMRWGLGHHIFVRPVHGIVALLDETIVDFEAVGIRSNRSTVGHRVHNPEAFNIAHAEDYENAMSVHSVIVDPAKRHRQLVKCASELAESAGCQVHSDPSLVNEHVELVEWPGLIIGSIEKKYLELPPEVVVSTLRHHQKCLILEGPDHALKPYFLSVIDRIDDPEGLIKTGNEWVIGARLADAGFFFDEDRKQTLSEIAQRLDRVEWHRVLGSLQAKADRVGALASELNTTLGFETGNLVETARLVKADLLTNMVNEFTDLQGVMGGHYLRLEGKDEALWSAARDHYQPVGFDGEIPASHEGRLLGLADRLDTIAGLYAVGEKPTGSKDPLGLRRAAQGLVKIVAEANWNLDLGKAIDSAISGVDDLATVDLGEVRSAIHEFVGDRVRRWLVDVAGVSGDTADAVMAAGWNDLPAAIGRAEALQDVRGSESFRALSLAFKRVLNITDGHELGKIDRSLFELPAEEDLHGQIMAFKAQLKILTPYHKFQEMFQAMEPIAESLDQFFIDVLVMAKDERVRANRIALLKTLGQDFLTLADLSKLQIEGDNS